MPLTAWFLVQIVEFCSAVVRTKQLKYEALVRAYHTDIFRYAVWLIKDRAIAEDVVQETFLRAWKSLDSLQDEAAAKAWLITILRRENARRFEREFVRLVEQRGNPQSR